MFNTSPNASPMTGQSFFGPNQMPAAMTDYGALASQFMTGGQMIHMPQAQYLTSPQYGAFRSTPQGQAFPTMQVQQASLWQTYLQANMGRLPGMGQALGDYTVNVYNPAIDQTRNLIMAQRRLQDMQSAMFGAGMDTLPMLAALPLGWLGLAGGIAAPSISAPYMDRLRTSRDLQNQSMSRIVGGSDMAGPLGRGFTLGASRSIDRHIRDLSARDVIFKEEDYRELTKLGVEAGMFDYAQSADQYKDIITRLSKQVKTLARIMESGDLKEIFDSLQRMQQMGAGPDTFTDIATFSRTASRMLGMSINDAINTHGQSGAVIYGQMGLTQYQGTLSGLGHAAGWTMAQRMGLVGRGELARQGGISGITQQTTESEAASLQRILRLTLPGLANGNFSGMDTNALNDFISGRTSFDQVMNQSLGRMNNTRDFLNYQANENQLTQDFFDSMDPYTKSQFMMRMYEGFGNQYAMLGEDATQQERVMAGMRLMGWDPELARMTADQWTSPEWQAQIRRQQEIERRQQDLNERVQGRRERSPMGRTRAAWSTFRNEIGEAVTGVFSPYGMYEKDYEEARQLEQAVRQDYGVRFGGRGSSALFSNISDHLESGGMQALNRPLDAFGYRGGPSSEDFAQLRVGRDFIAAQASDLDISEAREALLSNYGVNTHNLGLGFGRVRNLKDLSEDKVAESLVSTLRKSPKMAGKSTEELYRAAYAIKNDPELMKVVYNSIGANNSDLLNAVVDQTKTLAFNIDDSAEYQAGLTSRGIRDLAGSLTGSTWLGRDRTTDTDALVSMASEDINVIGYAGISAAIFGGLRFGGSEGQEHGLRSIREIAEFYGFDPEEFEKVFLDGGAGLEDLLKKRGVSATDAQQIIKAAKDRAKDFKSAGDISSVVGASKDYAAASYQQDRTRYLRENSALLSQYFGDENPIEKAFEAYRMSPSAFEASFGDFSNDPKIQAVVESFKKAFERYGESVRPEDLYSIDNETRAERAQAARIKADAEATGIDPQVKMVTTLENLQKTINVLNETLTKRSVIGIHF